MFRYLGIPSPDSATELFDIPQPTRLRLVPVDEDGSPQSLIGSRTDGRKSNRLPDRSAAAELDDRLEERNVISGLEENTCGFSAHLLVRPMTDSTPIDLNAKPANTRTVERGNPQNN